MQDVLSNVQTWALVLGIVTPIAVSFAQRPEWTPNVRTAVSVAVALVVGVLTVLANGEFDPADWFTTLGIVLAASQTAYTLVYKPSGLARAVEYATYKPRHSSGNYDA